MSDKGVDSTENPKRDSILKLTPVVAAIIAAISATASGASSYYAYRSQTAALRSTVFNLQLETVTALASDVSAISDGLKSIIEAVKDSVPMMKEFIQHSQGSSKLSRDQADRNRKKIRDIWADFSKDFDQAFRDFGSFRKDMFRVEVIFPPSISKKFYAEFKYWEINQEISRMKTIITMLRDAAFNKDKVILATSEALLAELETRSQRVVSLIDTMTDRQIAVIEEMRNYLAIDEIDAERQMRASMSMRPQMRVETPP